MTDTARSPPDLLSMPNEILAEICSHACNEDQNESRGKEWLRAVRLTCKLLHIPATIEFGKRFLASPPVMATRDSLEILAAICKHPLIGPQVTEIQFFGRRTHEDMSVDFAAESVTGCLRARDLEGLRKAREQVQSIMAVQEAELELEEYVGSFEHLENALSMVQSYGHGINLSVFTDANVKPFGFLEAMRHISDVSNGTQTNPFTEDSVGYVIRAMLVAAVRSGCHVKEIKLTADRSPNAGDPEEWVGRLDDGKDVLSAVKVLRVDMTDRAIDSEHDELISAVLEGADNLVEFYLNAHYDIFEDIQSYRPHFLGQAIESTQSHCLRVLELRQVACKEDELLSVLQQNKDSIKILTLSGIALLGSWRFIILWIRDHCSLAFLSVSTLVECIETNEIWRSHGRIWANEDGFGERDETGDLSSLDKFLEGKNAKSRQTAKKTEMCETRRRSADHPS